MSDTSNGGLVGRISRVLSTALIVATIWSRSAMAAPADHITGVAMALSDQPVAADQLAMGLRLAKALDLDETFHAGLEEIYAPLRAAARRKTASTPPDFRKRFLFVSDRVVNELERQDLDAVMTGMARFYVASLAPSELATITVFYEHPLVHANIGQPDELKKHEDELRGVMPTLEQMAAFDNISAVGVEVGSALFKRQIDGLPKRLTPRMCAALTSQKLVTECPD